MSLILKILNPKFEILNKIQPRTTKEFWVAQCPLVVLGKIQPRTILRYGVAQNPKWFLGKITNSKRLGFGIWDLGFRLEFRI